ncbi:hypothetical protein I350_00149 [Cryptococcus amylolentus CBS 6273]|uniref:WD40 repeat-like protein n=1 Tax=Cryptococcus amylolentus CBS 6273 TaxID=1296118 RepID=A0A1E3KE57_9TREE|nr:hypothetical protein I350_00149 [Cryptococcus amylolentus CBS 6273]
MSISLLITHPASACLSSLPKPISPSPLPTQTPLPIPSRFPPSSLPHLTPSPSGRLFLHSQESHFIWEYDHKGRRVGEMVFGKQDRVNRVVCGDGFVGVLLDGREGVEVMEKESERLGKWRKIKSVEGPGGVVTALASDGKQLLAVGTDGGGLVVCNIQDGTRTDVSLEGHSGSISPLLSFAPSLPNTLILPSQTSSTLLRIAPTPTTQTITPLSPFPFPSPASEPISSISFSPVTESPDGTRKGGLCALAAGGQVVLVGLDRAVEGSLGKSVGFGEGEEVGDVVFLDGATLGGRVKKGGKGGLLVKDLRALDRLPLELAFGEEVVKAQAKSSQSSKTATHRVSNTSPTSALGEINTNLPPASRPATHAAPGNKTKPKTPAPAPSRPSSSLASTKPRASSSTIVPSQTNRSGREKEKEERRSTSGPVLRDRERERERKPLGMSTRTIGVIEEEEAEQESPGPSRITSLVDGVLTSQVPEPVQQEEEEEWQEPGVDLTWALHPPRPSSRTQNHRTQNHRTQNQTGATHTSTRAVVEEGGMSEKEQIAHLRREMAFMHMDMLRMGRNLRNEMKAAVDPLKEEIQTSRVVIEKQRREIERLRRGY